MLRIVYVIPISLIAGLAIGSPNSSVLERMKQEASEPLCEQGEPGYVSYRGESHDLSKCVESFGAEHLRELRINSRGGEAWPTLQVALALKGKLDVLIVDGLCASSCANYLMPIAKTLIVEPNSLVLLHGSLNVDQMKRYLEENEERLTREAGNALREHMDREVERVINEVEEQVKVQEGFAAATIACEDWLDPNRHYATNEIPASMRYLMATEAMAERCLRTTRVEAFPELPSDAALLTELEANGISIATR